MKKKLTTAQVAKLLGTSDQTIANWVDRGALRAGRTAGGHRRIEADDLVEFLKRQKLRIPPELAPAAPTVLIIDRDAKTAEGLSRIIRNQNAHRRVLVANDGYTAGEMVAVNRPDVVILDLCMPGIDAPDVCRRIKAKDDLRETMVIAKSASLTPEKKRAMREAGAAACLPVPVDEEALGRMLKAAFLTR